MSPRPEQHEPSMESAKNNPWNPVESGFFQEGDELSADTVTTDDWNEPTLVCRKHPRLRKRTVLAVIGATALAACTTLAVSRREGSQSAATISTDPSPTTPATAPALNYPLPSPLPVAAGAVAVPIDKALPHEPPPSTLGASTPTRPEDQGSAELAVKMAKTEFERGRNLPAAQWANKAIALDRNLADAYVFLGGAEQARGRQAAAKAAYRRYLELAPRGRYAGDLRALLRSL